MGKHSGGAGARTAWVIGAIALCVVLVGGGVAWAVARDGGTAASPTPTSDVNAGMTDAAANSPVASSSPSSSPSSDPSAAAAASREDAAAAALKTCAATAKSGAQLGTAAAASARDWGIHIQAEKDNDSGKITFAQAEKLWAQSKSRSKSDLAGFASASTAWKKAQHGCDRIVDATKGTASATAGSACAANIEAVKKVVSTGTAVNDQWAAHVVMMAGKANMDHTAYRKKWLGMVNAAGPALDKHAAATSALAKAPRCTV